MPPPRRAGTPYKFSALALPFAENVASKLTANETSADSKPTATAPSAIGSAPTGKLSASPLTCPETTPAGLAAVFPPTFRSTVAASLSSAIKSPVTNKLAAPPRRSLEKTRYCDVKRKGSVIRSSTAASVTKSRTASKSAVTPLAIAEITVTPPASPLPAYRAVSPSPPSYTKIPRTYLTIDDLQYAVSTHYLN